MENTLKQKLAAGAQPIGTFFDTASVSLMECLGRTGLDFAIIDNEHSPIEAETTAALVRAAELSGICPLARVREISRPAVLKLLDVGVQGLIVPNVKTLEQVQELVNYAKYYPIGQRGFCPSRKDGWGFDGLGSVPETMRHFNGETLLFPQCETAEALDIIEDICAVDGVDGIFVGPFDLSISMGMPGQFDAPEFQAAITRIVAACHAAGKYCMFFTGTADGVVDPMQPAFSAFVFKIQANMNKAHRDRIAFMRICSGKFERDHEYLHVQGGKTLKLAQPQQLMAQERAIINEAYAGDIIGVFDPGIFSIGDTICDPKLRVRFEGIPTFAPEHFSVISQVDTMKRKQFVKGVTQIAQEGAIQIFHEPNSGMEEVIVGAVGVLQFEVLEYRLKNEYNIDIRRHDLSYSYIRWITSEGTDPTALNLASDTKWVQDFRGHNLLIFNNEWSIRWAEQKNPGLTLAEFSTNQDDEA